MGTKYMVEPLRQESKYLLQKAFPNNFPRYSPFVPNVFHKQPSDLMFFIEVLNLAEETSLQIIIPAALYSIAKQPVKTVLEGVTETDGSHFGLSASNLERWLIGRDEIAAAWRTDIYAWLHMENPLCTYAERCRVERLEIIRRFYPVPFVHLFEPWCDETWERTDICRACITEGRANYMEAQMRIWERLPAIYGLPSWEELRKAADSSGLEGSEFLSFLSPVS